MAHKDLFKNLDNGEKKKLKKTAMPSFIKPMLATLTDDYFSSKDWIYEHKFDGERCLAIKKNGVVHLMSRNEREINREYPEIAAALAADPADNFIIDGELVAVNKKGLSDFQMLQSRINLSNEEKIKERAKLVPVRYRIFDVLHAQGYDTRALPLLARKKILKQLLHFNRTLVYTTHRTPNGLTYFKQACKMGWEGLIAKRADSTYASIRSPDWLKFKCSSGQELVIAGYTKPQGSRSDFGALLVGYYKGSKLMYAGKVGTGFDQDALTLLGKKLRALEVKKCPFSNYDGRIANVHWVRPKLVADFKFAQWTAGGKLRVGRYKGLRDDKKAQDVVKEVAR